MGVSADFAAHVQDLLSLAGPVQIRAMFGGRGLFQRGAMFGLLDDDEIFLKTDELSRQEFLDARCRQWVYESPRGAIPTGYYRPPDDAHEDAEAMLPWARLAIAAAERAARAKAARAARPRRPAKGAARPAMRTGRPRVRGGSGRGRAGPASRSPRRR